MQGLHNLSNQASSCRMHLILIHQTMAIQYLFFPLLLLALCIFTKHCLNKIRNLPPSPFPTLPILGHLYLFKKPLHRTLSDISARFGPVLLLHFGSRPALLVSSPSAFEECFTKNDIVFANRPRLLAAKHVGDGYSTLAWAPYGENWRKLRRISSTEIFSSHRLQLLASIRADEVKSLLRRLSRSGGDQAVDMKAAFFEMVLVTAAAVAARKAKGNGQSGSRATAGACSSFACRGELEREGRSD